MSQPASRVSYSLPSYDSSKSDEASSPGSREEGKEQSIGPLESVQAAFADHVAAITVKAQVTTKILASLKQFSHSELEDLSLLFDAGFEYVEPDSRKFRAAVLEVVKFIIQYAALLNAREKKELSSSLGKEIEKLLPLKEKDEDTVDEDGFILV